VTVHSGIDPNSYDKPIDKNAQRSNLNLNENTRLVGAVGRLGQQKAPLDFVQMAALVYAKNPQIHFVWAGSGPLEDQVRKLSKELGITEACHFIGECKDIPSLLGIMDCFVLPSLWEGFPIVLLEAMATGVPIVATDIPGNDEAVTSGKNGWLVPPGDPSALAEKVLDLLNNTDQASAFSAFGRERIRQEFTRAKMLTSIQHVYQDVVGENKNK
jgi:glycosyltransferase involved in cell wall biosynthesis